MKKTLAKKILAVTLASALAIPLASCSKNNAPIASKENIFKSKTITVPMQMDYIEIFAAGEEQIYFKYQYTEKIEVDESEIMGGDQFVDDEMTTMTSDDANLEDALVDEPAFEEDATEDSAETTGEVVAEEPMMYDYAMSEGGQAFRYENHSMLASMDFEGNVVFDIEMTQPQNDGDSGIYTNYLSMFPNNDGTFSMLQTTSEYYYDEATDSYEENSQIDLLVYDNAGNFVTSSPIDTGDDEDSSYFGNGEVIFDDAQNMYFTSYNGVRVISKDGEIVFTYMLEEPDYSQQNNKYENVRNVVKARDNGIYLLKEVSESNNDEYTQTVTASKINLETGKLDDPIELSGNFYDCSSGNADYDILINANDCIYGYNFDVQEQVKVINWLSSGIDSSNFRDLVTLSNGDFVAFSEDYFEDEKTGEWKNECEFKIMSKLDPSEVKDRTVVTVAGSYLPRQTLKMIAKFNENSEDYVVEFTDYSIHNGNSSDTWSAGSDKLNNDLISGKIPDIIFITDDIPVDNYIKKGLFKDLYDFIEDDETINMDDYLPNIIEAMSVDGKLYTYAPAFALSTMIAKTSIVGTESGLSYEEFNTIMANYPDAEPFEYMDRTQFLNMAMSYFKDFQLNDENIASLKSCLEIANTLRSNEEMEEYWNTYDYTQNKLKENETIFSGYYLGDFDSYNREKYGRFGEDITFIGFPNANETSSLIRLSNEFAITQKAQNPDGAWAFAKEFITSEDKDILSYSLPTKLSIYDEMIENAKIDKDDKYWQNDGTEVEIPALTDADINVMMDLIKSADTVNRSNQKLNEIILEEADAYFSGQKSVDEIVKIILNRANIYISENS